MSAMTSAAANRAHLNSSAHIVTFLGHGEGGIATPIPSGGSLFTIGRGGAVDLVRPPLAHESAAVPAWVFAPCSQTTVGHHLLYAPPPPAAARGRSSTSRTSRRSSA